MPFRRQVAGLEKLRGEYRGRVTFVIVYQREAHAGQRIFMAIEQPRTMSQRSELARRVREELDIETTIVLDDMMNSTRRAYGARFNEAFIVDRDGRIVHKERWANPREWRPVLEGLFSR